MTDNNVRKYTKPHIRVVYFERILTTEVLNNVGSPNYTNAANAQNYVIYNLTHADATTTTRVQRFNSVIQFNN